MSRAWQGGSTRQWRNQRAKALRRDNNRCVECGEKATEVDHINHRAAGGTDELANLRSLCTPCHAHYTRQQTTQAGKLRRGTKRQREKHPGLI